MSTQTEKLAADVRTLVVDAEELVKATATQAGEKIVDIRNRAQTAVNNLKPQLTELETRVAEKAKATATATDAYVHSNPWTAIGIATGVGLVVGLLIGRR